ncbi:MAG TPA: ATP-binding protein [Thermoanaerobaculia bacterium]|nr:ATP-binding protein [Thermoanaerobaculia bacterium]
MTTPAIQRSRHLDALEGLLERFPVVGILGARQVGKTTLARELAARRPDPTTFFDLEDPADLARLGEPMLALRDLRGLVVIDEVQRRPDLYPVLRVLADRPERPARFLVLGSASPERLRQTSESLAGRIFYHELGGFALDEVGAEARDRLWLRGGFPSSFLAESDATSAEWRRGFVRTFLERDLPQLGVAIAPDLLRRFWTMIAHYHGQVWNGAELARSLGVSQPTVRRYLDLLTSALVLRQLQPWFENLGKRQVKSPKVYIADSGLLHTLLNLETREDLEGHPKVGASWEGFALCEVLVRLGARPAESFFWATHAGAELDLLVVRGNRRLGFEFKLTDAPRLTPSMRTALEDLKLDRIDVVHAGEHTFPLGERVRAVGLGRVGEDVEALG